ncbi:hypothetical protein [Ferruginibacter sp.]|nr:hypothetical protein [Ferruginibacter sp.]
MPIFNLKEAILKEHSKAQCSNIVQWVGASQQRFDELFNLFLHDEYRVVQRAGWPVSYCVIAHPEFIKKHWAALIKNLQQPNLHNAVKRNSIRLLQDIDIPEKYQGPIMDLCFKYVESPTEAIAVKAFALTVLTNLAKQYPEIIPEIKLIIEDQSPCFTAALKVRAREFLKGVGKI